MTARHSTAKISRKASVASRENGSRCLKEGEEVRVRYQRRGVKGGGEK
jgi:hypothetical protein